MVPEQHRIVFAMSDKRLSDSTTSNSGDDVCVRPALQSDLSAISDQIRQAIEARRLLRRTMDELEELIPQGFVAEASGGLVGFAALEIYSAKLAEIRSLFVIPSRQGQGIGRRLVQACVDLAHGRSVLEVMAITSSEEFFRSCGFDYTLPGEKKALFFQTRELE
jgi:N-acetylglutamate synthase-like GNAT family acetyltransferase